MKYIIMGLAGIGLCGASMYYGSRIGMGEILALLIAHPEVSPQELRDRFEMTSLAEDATFEERSVRWAVENCDKRIDFFKSIVAKEEEP